ncbi:MAG: mandelate racemase/muconate lactonizing enzyme family protein [Thermomicrobiales bacterium]
MKITAIEAIPVSIPSRGFNSALGRFATYEYAIVIVHTDEGIEGYGEISTLWDGTSGVQCAFVEHAFRPALIGEDPFAINRCLSRMATPFEGAWPARAGVEMALYDIVGKALNTPVYNLLGGNVRESVVLSRSISMGEPAAMAAEAQAAVADGFTCVKVKVGRPERDDAASVAAVRAAVGPEVTLRVDANMGWPTAKDAIRQIKAMEPYGIHSVEQPLPPGDLGALRLVRASVDTPIMVDESVWGPRDAWQILRAEAADLINIYVAESGGLTNSALIFRMAELAGVPCVIGAMPELGIGTAAGVHLGLAMTNLHDPCDACGVIYHDVDVIAERFTVRDGQIWPLPGPGLGVTLDRDALARYRAA